MCMYVCTYLYIHSWGRKQREASWCEASLFGITWDLAPLREALPRYFIEWEASLCVASSFGITWDLGVVYTHTHLCEAANKERPFGMTWDLAPLREALPQYFIEWEASLCVALPFDITWDLVSYTYIHLCEAANKERPFGVTWDLAPLREALPQYFIEWEASLCVASPFDSTWDLGVVYTHTLVWGRKQREAFWYYMRPCLVYIHTLVWGRKQREAFCYDVRPRPMTWGTASVCNRMRGLIMWGRILWEAL